MHILLIIYVCTIILSFDEPDESAKIFRQITVTASSYGLCSVSQPFGICVPQNQNFSVKLPFCVPPRAARVPPGENHWSSG
jgi:predicted transcriptional regulator